MVEPHRQVKDGGEKRKILRAVRVAEEAFERIRAAVRPGRTERELANMLEAAMRDLGAESASFPPIVAVAERTSLPHARPTDREVASGDAILFDWGARVDGYCSDLTRMLYVDRITPFFARLHGMVHEAQRRALRMIKAGLSAKDIDGAARDFFKSKRRGKQFSHGLGHGIGLEVHEGPTVNHRSDSDLKLGMVFTVEPGLYLPGRGGVRIEDDVQVTRDGCRVLTSAPKSLQEAVLQTGT
jgi:Xaa-Pro aminopeptidase